MYLHTLANVSYHSLKEKRATVQSKKHISQTTGCQLGLFHLETACIFTLFHLPINLTHALR